MQKNGGVPPGFVCRKSYGRFRKVPEEFRKGSLCLLVWVLGLLLFCFGLSKWLVRGSFRANLNGSTVYSPQVSREVFWQVCNKKWNPKWDRHNNYFFTSLLFLVTIFHPSLFTVFAPSTLLCTLLHITLQSLFTLLSLLLLLSRWRLESFYPSVCEYKSRLDPSKRNMQICILSDLIVGSWFSLCSSEGVKAV